MAKSTLRYTGLASGLSDGKGPRLMLRTPANQLREAPLTRRDLIKIINRAAAALEEIERSEARDRT